MNVPAGELMPLIEEEVLAGGRCARIAVSGSSMHPFLHHGDIVEIAPFAEWPPAVGDVLLAKRGGGSYVLHRVARVTGDAFHLLGDAQQHLEGPFAREQAIGCVSAAWRGSRQLPLSSFAWRLSARLWLMLTPLRPRLARGGRALVAPARRLAGPKPAEPMADSNAHSLRESDYSQLIAVLRGCPETIDWPALMRVAAEQEVLPLVCERASHLPPDLQPPPEIAQRLRAIRLQCAAQAACRLEQLRSVLEAMRYSGVLAIPLKGSHLACLVYPSPALRQMGDLDILVHREDLDRVRSVLEGIGWQSHTSSDEVNSHHDRYVLPGSHTEVEAHWTLRSKHGHLPDAVLNDMWSRAREAEAAWTQTLVLSPEDVLLSLILHIYHSHGFAVSLRHIYDLVAVNDAHGDDIDWTYVAERTRVLGLERPIAVLKALLSEWFGVELPMDLVGEERGAGFGPAIALAKHSILSSRRGRRADRSAMQLCFSSSRAAYVAEAWRKLFLPKRRMEMIYGCRPGSPAVYLLYALRAVQMCCRYLPVAWRLRRNPGSMEQARAWDWLEGLS